MGFVYAIVRFFQTGGFFMFPILLVLAVGLAIAFERWVQLKRIQDANQKNMGLAVSGDGKGRVR